MDLKKTPKSRLQFSLQTLFVVITFCAVCLYSYITPIHERNVFFRTHYGSTRGLMSLSLGIKLNSMPQKPLPFGWSFLGAFPIHHMKLEDNLDVAEIRKIQRLFPDAYIIVGDKILPDN
jgi:hypothetical protein